MPEFDWSKRRPQEPMSAAKLCWPLERRTAPPGHYGDLVVNGILVPDGRGVDVGRGRRRVGLRPVRAPRAVAPASPAVLLPTPRRGVHSPGSGGDPDGRGILRHRGGAAMFRVIDPEERPMNRIQTCISLLSREFPGWLVRYDASDDVFVARHPQFADNGVEVQGRLPELLHRRLVQFTVAYSFRLTPG